MASLMLASCGKPEKSFDMHVPVTEIQNGIVSQDTDGTYTFAESESQLEVSTIEVTQPESVFAAKKPLLVTLFESLVKGNSKKTATAKNESKKVDNVVSKVDVVDSETSKPVTEVIIVEPEKNAESAEKSDVAENKEVVSDEATNASESKQSEEIIEVTEETVAETAADTAVEDEADNENPPLEEAVTESETTILIINECGANIGMVSFINPSTKEQTNLCAMNADEMLILKLSWPSNAKNFRIATYDEVGDLIMAKDCDFSLITEAAAVCIVGEGEVTDITSEVE